ncbi:hypothetical protein K438DRAFT_1765812 [Mycena galopus ATCC 62051]|nr:hypothetical protein K438DRAFT_1765812 [Mycena galopus ATCC 62051]
MAVLNPKVHMDATYTSANVLSEVVLWLPAPGIQLISSGVDSHGIQLPARLYPGTNMGRIWGTRVPYQATSAIAATNHYNQPPCEEDSNLNEDNEDKEDTLFQEIREAGSNMGIQLRTSCWNPASIYPEPGTITDGSHVAAPGRVNMRALWRCNFIIIRNPNTSETTVMAGNNSASRA